MMTILAATAVKGKQAVLVIASSGQYVKNLWIFERFRKKIY